MSERRAAGHGPSTNRRGTTSLGIGAVRALVAGVGMAVMGLTGAASGAPLPAVLPTSMVSAMTTSSSSTTLPGAPTMSLPGSTTTRPGTTTTLKSSTTTTHPITTTTRPKPTTTTTKPRSTTKPGTTTTTRARATSRTRPTTTTVPAWRSEPGYWVVRANGSVNYFDAANLGDLSRLKLRRPIVGAAPTPDGRGYWLVASDGGVFAFGDAKYLGSPAGTRLSRPIVGMARAPDGLGYWLVSANGGVFSYGDARFYGSMGGRHLNKPIVAIAATADGAGYWLVASDGGIFNYGDAKFYGAIGAQKLNKPVVAIAPTPDGRGYWLVASDGGLFNYGDAKFYGSAAGPSKLPAPIASMAGTPDGRGYWLVGQNGRLFPFGDAPYLGSAITKATSANVVALAVTTDPAPPVTTTLPASTTTSVPATTTTLPTQTTSPKATTVPTTTVPTTTVPTTTVPATTTTVPSGTGSYPYPSQGLGYDVSWPQCKPRGSANVMTLPANARFAVVGVNNGTINTFNPCFNSEVAWAAKFLSVYIILDPAPGGNNAMESNGPDAYCAKTSNTCEGYDWGYNYATNDLAFVKSDGLAPRMWWLDIETAERWPTAKKYQAVNAAIIQGAIDAIKHSGHKVGIYSTWYQWGEITGSYVPPGAIPIWVAGADYVSGDINSAVSYCARALQPGNPGSLKSSAIGFAGGVPWLVQYGYGTTGVLVNPDPDYSCGAPAR